MQTSRYQLLTSMIYVLLAESIVYKLGTQTSSSSPNAMNLAPLLAVPHDALALDIRCHVGTGIPVSPERLEHITAIVLVVGAQDRLEGLSGL